MISVLQTNSIGAGLKILLVEESAEDTELIREMLGENTRVPSIDVTATVGFSEVDAILNRENFDVILLNIPQPEGQEFDNFFRMLESKIDIPIVLLTLPENEELAIELIAAGAEDYLIKTEADNRLLVRSLRCACARYKMRVKRQLSQEKYPAAVDNLLPEETTETIKDITAQLLAAQELQVSKNLLNYTIDAVDDSIFVTDEQHRWILLNDAFCKLFGKQREELLGKCDRDFLPQTEAAILGQSDAQVFMTGEARDSEEIFTDFRGQQHILYTKKTVFKNNDGSQLLVGTIRDITEEKNQQIALKKSEERLSHLAASLPGVIFQFLLAKNGQKSFIYLSHACRELYEIAAEEFMQNSEIAFKLIHPDDRQKFEESMRISAQHMQPWQHEWRAIMPSGKLKWLQGFSRPERVKFASEIAQKGDIIWEGIVLETTALKQAEAALRESEERFRSLVENIPGAIYRCLYDAGWQMEFISDEIETISGYPVGDFIRNRRLSFTSIIHPEDSETVDRAVGKAVDSRQPYYVEYRIVRADGAVRWISERGRPTYCKDGLLLWLDGAIFDITDRKQAELTLQQVTQAIESASDAIAIADLDGYSIYHNQAFIHRYGYSVEELNNAGGPAVMYVKSQQLRKLFMTLRKGKSWKSEIKLKAKNGEIIDAQLQADCIKNSEGQPIGMMAIITDLTEIKRAESALLLSQERLQLAVSSSSLGLWDWNILTGETYFDAQWKKTLGYEENDIENNYSSWERLLHPEDKARVMEALKKYLEGRTDIYELELRMLNKAGNWQWIMGVGKIVEYSEFGTPVRMTGTHKDISARVAAEAEKTQLIASLQKLTYQLQSAQTVARLGNWEFDVESGMIAWSDELFRIHGKVGNQAPTYEELLQQIHPDDRSKFASVVQQATIEGTAYDIDYRVYLPSGEIKYINAKGEIVKNEFDRVVGLFGTAMDITDRKLAETALQESEERFRAVYEQAAIGIVQVRPTGEFLKVNQGFCKIVGYSPAELSLLRIGDISYPADLEVDRESERRMLAGEILNYSVEKRFICKNGALIWTNVTVSLVRDISGEPSYMIGAIEDISDRKQAEAALRQQLKRERLIVAMLERIRSSLNLAEILTKAVAEVRHFLQTDRTIIYQFNPDWSGVVAVESVGDNWQQTAGSVIKDSCFKDTYGSKYKHGRVKAIGDIYSAQLPECYINLLAQFQVKAHLVVPIVQGDMLWGLLIAHECAGPRPWLEFEIECLKQISVQLAIAIQQSMLFEQAQTEIADRKQAEAALQESEARERSKALQLEVAINKLRTTQSQLVQNEKMVSLGQLVAGVAHEINNPVSFIHGNLNPARNYVLDLLDLIKIYQNYLPDPPIAVLNKINEIDLDYVAEDLPKLFNSMRVGTERIIEIVKSLRNFSRLDESDRKFANIHEGIESSLMILQNRLKSHNSRPAIQIVKDYEKLPKIECFPGQLNQVFMNILINAIDALEERDKLREAEECKIFPSTVTIRTYLDDREIAVISIADNGPGIRESVISRLFDPFFTTKPVGKGTGLGLSISHSIIVDRHGGNLRCISALGTGAEFLIEIPVRQKTVDS
ncbi:MAG: PAS domain S-box protein [Richelia sp. CSU_2_1]|nr:PAS domain S-box protein [Richelia sp. CSU_2_1]